MAGLVPAVILALSDAVAATGDESGAAAKFASLPQREVLPLVQAWRRAEECAAAIPGGEALVGRGDSMLPIYPDSTVLVVQRMRMEDLRAGMVVVFIGDSGRPVAHTLVASSPRGWSVKGVGNEFLDRTRVRAQNYLGTVVRAFLPFWPEAGAPMTAGGREAGQNALASPPRTAVTVALSDT